jgi:hypothetical protein
MYFPIILGMVFSTASLSTARVVHSHHYERRQTANDFGSCGSPEIKFAFGLDGRTEAAFQPVNLTAFNHGSADNIPVITGFIVQQLNTPCHASAATIALASKAATAANGATHGGGQADIWNKMLLGLNVRRAWVVR